MTHRRLVLEERVRRTLVQVAGEDHAADADFERVVQAIVRLVQRERADARKRLGR